ncbi:putative sulfotransferase 1C2 [Apostichopus japonicus]|uniref:Putative sulfotransferase 1C2 n=1 Tax=Stichopus japonicus TaxID=307972 RepID=A0A2G8JD24_STIJA|nr:putative sulfotransferase 1C2 [Apostichopus japonicus]
MAIHYTQEQHDQKQRELAKLFGIPEEASAIAKRHDFEGVMFTNTSPPKSLLEIRDWETKEDDVFVATYPKSDFKVPGHEVYAKMDSPRITVTHLPWQFLPKQLTEGKKGKIIYVMRNPKDVLASMSRFTFGSSGIDKETKMWEYALNTFLTGDMNYGSWFDHVGNYWKHRNLDNVFFTTYEELKRDFQAVAKPLSKFLLGKELDEEALKAVETNSSVKNMKKSYDEIEKSKPDGKLITRAMGANPFIQKGVTGTWKEFFTVAENELFDSVCKEKIAEWGFDVAYQ